MAVRGYEFYPRVLKVSLTYEFYLVSLTYQFYLQVLKVSLTSELRSLVRDTFSTRR